MSAPKLFRDHHFQTPGYFRRQGCIYLWRLDDGRHRLVADCHGSPPHGAIWSMRGKMERLRSVAERIIAHNEKQASEDGAYVVFKGAPEMPAQIPKGLSSRPRVGPPSDVYFGDKAHSNAQPVETKEEQDDTLKEQRPQAPKRKRRTRRAVTAPQAEPSVEAVEDPAVDVTQPETSDGDETF